MCEVFGSDASVALVWAQALDGAGLAGVGATVIMCGTVQDRSHLMCLPLQATVTQVTQTVMANSAYGETTCDQMVSSDLLAR